MLQLAANRAYFAQDTVIMSVSDATSGGRNFALHCSLGAQLVSALIFLAAFPFTSAASATPDRWTTIIAEFEADDDVRKTSGGSAVVFVGSSSIRRWATLQRDFPNTAVINRGFGGAGLADCLFYFDKIVVPNSPRLVVLYAGENDLVAHATPQAVASDFRKFCEKLHVSLPRTKIICLAIKPSPNRWSLECKIAETNALLSQECLQDERRVFVDTCTPLLGDDRQPRNDFFCDDGVHLNARGYELWTRLLTPLLEIKVDAGFVSGPVTALGKAVNR